MKDSIIFAYNAKSGLFAGISDTVIKIVAPSQYECNLCKVTFGPLSMKEEWAQFLETLPQTKVFLHKNELVGEYAVLQEYGLPAVFLRHEDNFSVLISKEELNTVQTVVELQHLLTSKFS